MTEAVLEMKNSDVMRMVDKVREARRDPVMIDFTRVVCAHFGKMVEHFSKKEGRPISAHNNKTLFVEGIDIWCRNAFNRGPESKSFAMGLAGVADPKIIAQYVMKPWYEAMSLDNPAEYVMPRRAAPPVYSGTPADLTAFQLGMAACLEIYPLRIRMGIADGEIKHVWGKLRADGTWYDSDVSTPRFRLGEFGEYPEYDEVEVALEEAAP